MARAVEQYGDRKQSLQALSERYGINPKTVAKWMAEAHELGGPTDGTEDPAVNGAVGRGVSGISCVKR